MSKIISAERAAELIKDNSTVACGCMGLAGWPEEIARAIEKRFVQTGKPQNLYFVQGSNIGDRKERGVDRLGYERLIKRWMGAHLGASKKIVGLIAENKIEAYCIPQGVIVNLWREIAAGRPGLITKVGLGTFIDPRIEGGKMNDITTEDIFKLIKIEGEEYMFYKAFPVDVALIRGSTIDEKGNLSMEKEGLLMEQLQIAQAAKNSGGIVIAQAEYLAQANSLHPKQVKVPGILVDYIVIAKDKDSCWQTSTQYFNPCLAGDLRAPLGDIPTLPMSAEKIIARRAAMEIIPNSVVNLGVGMAVNVASIANEERINDLITFTTEAGAIGGVPAGGRDFGHSYNAEANIEHGAMFDMYDGGVLDITFLGLAQADRHGNVNVSKFSGRSMGAGGFVNISRNTKKVVFTGTFTAGGLETKIEDGKVKIISEGSVNKFVNSVEQITFSGKYAKETKQQVLYITERCVFYLENGEMILVEIAPGIDLQRDIIAHMDFRPKIHPDLKEMPEKIFAENWGMLKALVESKEVSI